MTLPAVLTVPWGSEMKVCCSLVVLVRGRVGGGGGGCELEQARCAGLPCPSVYLCLPLHSIKGLQFLETAFSWCLFISEAFGLLTGQPHVLRRRGISPSRDCTSFRSPLPPSRSFGGDCVALAAFLAVGEPRHSHSGTHRCTHRFQQPQFSCANGLACNCF